MLNVANSPQFLSFLAPKLRVDEAINVFSVYFCRCYFVQHCNDFVFIFDQKMKAGLLRVFRYRKTYTELWMDVFLIIVDFTAVIQVSKIVILVQ